MSWRNWKDYQDFYIEELASLTSDESDFEDAWVGAEIDTDYEYVNMGDVEGNWHSEDETDEEWDMLEARLCPLESFSHSIKSRCGDEDWKKVADYLKEKYDVDLENDFMIYVESYYGDWNHVEFFKSLEEAKETLKELEWCERKPVEYYIEEFEKRIEEKTGRSVSAKWEKGWREPDTFQVFLNGDEDFMIVDNAWNLDERTEKDVIDFIEFANGLEDEYGIHVSECHKYQDSIGFNRYYEIKLYKDGYSVDTEVELDGRTMMQGGFMQGNKRSLKDVIDSCLDIDEILEELDERKREDMELD